MEFHFITVGRSSLATITDPTRKPRALCFRDRVDAVKYIDYLSTYRSKFGRWPSVDLSEPVTKIETLHSAKKRTPEYVRKFIKVNTLQQHELNGMSMSSGLSYFYCHSFDYADELTSLKLRGQEIDGAVDEEMYKNWLECNLKID
jgi:hypothetical protein